MFANRDETRFRHSRRRVGILDDVVLLPATRSRLYASVIYLSAVQVWRNKVELKVPRQGVRPREWEANAVINLPIGGAV